MKNFYPRPLRGGRRAGLVLLLCHLEISIHALCEEGDSVVLVSLWGTVAFLSTPSARRATSSSPPSARRSQFLSTPSARRATRAHEPQLRGQGRFLSTPSARRATLRATSSPCFITYFYPRPLRGGRQKLNDEQAAEAKFLSTPSARRATSRRCRCCRSRPISIHALCEEGDPSRWRCGCCCRYFYPRPLRGGRQGSTMTINDVPKFLSTPSARRATRGRAAPWARTPYFYPRPLRGGRLRQPDRLDRGR